MTDSTPPENAHTEKPRALPAPVRMAFEAISGLHLSDKGQIAGLRKNLPVLAVKLAQRDENISPEILAGHALKGQDHIKSLCDSFNRAATPPTPAQDYARALRVAVRNEAHHNRQTSQSGWKVLASSAIVGTGEEIDIIQKAYFRRVQARRDERQQDLHTLLKKSVHAGNDSATERLLALGAPASFNSSDDPAELAAETGNEKILKRLLEKSKRPDRARRVALAAAAKHGHLNILRILTDGKKILLPVLQKALNNATAENHPPIIRHLLTLLPAGKCGRMAHEALLEINEKTAPETFDLLAPLTGQDPVALQRSLVTAIGCDNAPLVRHLLSRHRDHLPLEENHLMIALTSHANEALAVLLETAPIAPQQQQKLAAEAEGNITYAEAAALLRHKGITSGRIWPKTKKAKEQLVNINRWHEKHGAFPPPGLGGSNPDLFNPVEFDKVKKLLSVETIFNGDPIDKNVTACKAIAYFGTARRTLKYFERFAHELDLPLNTGLSELLDKLPSPDRADIDYRIWGDAILQTGPGMTEILARYGDRIKEPAKAANGKAWSLSATQQATATLRYRRGAQYPGLAEFCARNDIDALSFSSAASLLERWNRKSAANDNKPKPNSRMPDIRLSGNAFDMPGYSFYRLPSGDPRGLFLGNAVDNCQKIGGTAETAVRHGFLSPQGGFYVVANDITGEIIGETWAWRAKTGEIVFDSLETLGQRIDTARWTKICTAAAQSFAENARDVSGLCVGTDGGTPGMPDFPQMEKPAIPRSRLRFTDAKTQYLVWKR